MENNNLFVTERLWLQIKRDIIGNYKIIGISLIAIIGILIVLNLLNSISYNGTWNQHNRQFLLALFIGGFILTGMSFPDLRNRGRSIQYLTMPSSALEKFLSMFLMSTVGYTLVLALLYALAAFITNSLGKLLFNTSYMPFNPCTLGVGKAVVVYFILHSVFFLGATIFKKVPVLMTIVWLFIIGVAIGMLTGISVRIIFGESMHQNFENQEVFLNPFFTETLPYIFRILFWYVLAPLCWILSYLKLKEREV